VLESMLNMNDNEHIASVMVICFCLIAIVCICSTCNIMLEREHTRQVEWGATNVVHQHINP